MLTSRSDLIPGLYPLITCLDPAQKRSGRDNLGLGHTEHGERFLVKEGGRLGAAEFIGAKICDACGVPACQPTVVTIESLHGQRHVFGSRLESGVHLFDQANIIEWQQVLSQCCNRSAFSAMLAIDLVLGNDDRHWDNWLVQQSVDQNGAACYRLRGLDFSRSWPMRHPCQPPVDACGPEYLACMQGMVLTRDRVRHLNLSSDLCENRPVEREMATPCSAATHRGLIFIN